MRRSATSFLLLLGLLLQACNSDEPAAAPPASPGPADAAQIAILSPADGSTVAALPLTLRVQLSNVDPASMRALLSGVDITASFGAADGSGTRVAVVSMPALNLGTNQLQISAASVQAEASFTVDLNGAGAAPGAAMPLLVPIRTRVLCDGCDGSSETHYGIVLYKDPADPDSATTFSAPTLPAGAVPNQGFQLLFLRRNDLSLVANTSIANPATNSWQSSALLTAMTGNPPAGCGNPAPGCLLIVQSLGSIGYTPCFAKPDSLDCDFSSTLLQAGGASGRLAYANGANGQVAYSFVGNIGSGANGAPAPVSAGIYHERLTCSGGNGRGGPACDALGDPGTSATAPAGATRDRIGNLAGALVRDNYFNYTYVHNAPLLAFSSVYDSDNVSHGFTIDGKTIWSGFASVWPQQGGIHVVIVDATNPATVIENQWYPSSACANQLYGADGRSGAGGLIGRYNSPGYLVFVAAFGDTTYDPSATQCTYENAVVPNNARSDSARFAGLMDSLGGTWQVWFLMNYPNTGYPASSGFSNFRDDYTLVGSFRDTRYTGLQDARGAELSSIISRETARYPRPSRIEGVLALDHQGYYRPQQATHNLGLFNPNLLAAATASRLNPVRWPLPGGSNPQAAYEWISRRLCCKDIRAAYVNQNVSPELWLLQLQQMSYLDAGAAPAYSSEDFSGMQRQLGTEFRYLSVVRRLQGNIFQLYQQRQAAVPLLLIQAQDEVLRNLQLDLNTKVSQPKWASITNSVLGVLGGVTTIAGLAGAEGGGPVIATGLKTGIALAQLGVTLAADETGRSAGTSLKAEENLEVAAARVAANAVDSYNTNLGQIASQFDRIVSDWGRLKAVGGPLTAGLIPWDNSASFLLMQAYDRVIRREFYTALIQSNTQVTVFEQASTGPFNNNTWYDPGGSKLCQYDRTTVNPYYGLAATKTGSPVQQLPILFYPSGQPNTILSNSRNYPYDYSWSVWALVLAAHGTDLCPFSHPQPGTFGLFNPLDPDDSSSLGAYRLWWFTRNPQFSVFTPADFDHGGNWGSCDRQGNGDDCGGASR